MHTSLLTYLSFYSEDREVVTEGGSMQNFTIPHIKNVADDPVFSVHGDIAMNWRYQDNGVRITLTGGHLSDEGSNNDNTHGLEVHLWLKINERAEEENTECKIEVSNIQDCPFPSCGAENQKVQGKNHGIFFKSGPIYGNYAIYISNNTTNFPTDQKLGLEMKSKRTNFMIALYHIFLKSVENLLLKFFQ